MVLYAMTSHTEPGDPHGYAELEEKLTELETELDSVDRAASAELIRHARRFYGAGSPTEFLGEARNALEGVVGSTEQLPSELESQITSLIVEINEGFRRIGGG